MTNSLKRSKSIPFEDKSIEEESDEGPLSRLKWIPTSGLKLYQAEERLLKGAQSEIKKGFVKLKNGDQIWTAVANNRMNETTPLVMVHGLGGGTGLWVLNFDALSQHRALYTFDLLGFGQSSRPKFSQKTSKAEEQFISSIEEWRETLGIKEMILLGHSFGGYLAASYALKYPNRVRSLLLVDPWGFEGFSERVQEFPCYIRFILALFSCCGCNPLFVVRGAGPYGPRLVRKSRADFRQRYNAVTSQDKHAVHNYIYHCNAASPSGEEGFRSLTEHALFPLNPMLSRISDLDASIPITFIYGEHSWIGEGAGYETERNLPHHIVKVFVIKGAAHHVYADQPAKFHEIVNQVCSDVDQ